MSESTWNVELPAPLKVGVGAGPWCDNCGLDLSLSDEQVAYIRVHGSPIPRPLCTANQDGMHRCSNPTASRPPKIAAPGELLLVIPPSLQAGAAALVNLSLGRRSDDADRMIATTHVATNETGSLAMLRALDAALRKAGWVLPQKGWALKPRGSCVECGGELEDDEPAHWSSCSQAQAEA